MTPIQFGIKRAHHRSLRFSEKALRPFGITPARFDMLRCIEKLETAFQYQIAQALGVSAPTVSRMMKALVKLGLVYKGPFDEYPRAHLVQLSKEGEALIARVLRELEGSGMLDHVQNVVGSWSNVKRRSARHLDRFYNHLRWVRFTLGDTAIRVEEWPPDEDSPFDERRLRRPVALLNDMDRRQNEFYGLVRGFA